MQSGESKSFTKIKSGFVVTFYHTGIADIQQDIGKGRSKTTQKIIQAILNNQTITRKELSMILEITEYDVKYHLYIMQKERINQ